MPTHPGPWQASPGPLTIAAAATAPGSSSVQYEHDLTTTDFPTLCEPAPVSGGYGGGSGLQIEHSFGPVDFYTLYQTKLVYQVDDDLFLLPAAWTPTLPWPANAVGWEWENTTPQLWVDTIDLAVTLDEDPSSPANTDVTVLLVPADPATLTLFPSGLLAGLPEDRPIPGADLTTTYNATMPTSDSAVTITASGIDRSLIKNIDDVSIGGSFKPLTVVLAFDNQRTHVPPAVDTGRRLTIRFGSSPTIHFTPPRWRFLFTVQPRVRQFPRDDSLGGSPRQGKTNGATSVQGSARQGWRGTYR